MKLLTFVEEDCSLDNILNTVESAWAFASINYCQIIKEILQKQRLIVKFAIFLNSSKATVLWIATTKTSSLHPKIKEVLMATAFFKIKKFEEEKHFKKK